MEEIKPQRLDIGEMLRDEGWDFYVRGNKYDLNRKFHLYSLGWATLAPGEAEKVLAKVKPPYGFMLAGVVPAVDVTSPETLARDYGWDQPLADGDEQDDEELEFAENPQKVYGRYLDNALNELPRDVLGAKNEAEAFLLKATLEDGTVKGLVCCLFELAG